jgi:hypothetical protein
MEQSKIDALIARELRPCYKAYGDASFRTAPIAASEIIPLSKMVVKSRLDRWLRYLPQLEQQLIPFEPFLMGIGNQCRLVLPPIVEQEPNSKEYILIDGTHRLLAHRLAATNAHAHVVIVVLDHHEDLPCLPSTWNGIEVSIEQPSLERVLPGIKPELFRHVTSHLNSARFIFASKYHAKTFCNS